VVDRRKSIWPAELAGLGGRRSFGEPELDRLAALSLNGRKIKNVFYVLSLYKKGDDVASEIAIFVAKSILPITTGVQKGAANTQVEEFCRERDAA